MSFFDEMENYTRKMVIDGKVCAQMVICVAGMSATPHQRHPGPTHTNAQARSILKIIWNFTRHEHNENKTFLNLEKKKEEKIMKI